MVLLTEDVTVLEGVHKLRARCSQHYRDLLKLRDTRGSSQQTPNQGDMCGMPHSCPIQRRENEEVCRGRDEDDDGDINFVQ